MIAWYISVNRLLRDIENKSRDALRLYEQNDEKGAKATKEYIINSLVIVFTSCCIFGCFVIKVGIDTVR